MSTKTASTAARRRRISSNGSAALTRLRRQIDRLDTAILRLLVQRARLALSVGRVKKREGKRVFDPERERAVLRRVVAANRGPLSATAIERIFREIVRQHRRLAQLVMWPS